MSSQNLIVSEKQKLILRIKELKKKIALTQEKINDISKQENEIPVSELESVEPKCDIFDTEEDFDENFSKITSKSRITTSNNESVKGFKRLMKRLNKRKEFNNIKELIVSNDVVVSVFDEKENQIETSGFKTSKIKTEPLSKINKEKDSKKEEKDSKKEEKDSKKEEKSILNLKIDELKEIAKSLKLKGFSKLKKQELIELINLNNYQKPIDSDDKTKEKEEKEEKDENVEKNEDKSIEEKHEKIVEKPKKKQAKKQEKDENVEKNEDKSIEEKDEKIVEKPIEKMTLIELKEVAKKLKISGAYKMKKEELLKNIKESK